MKLDGVSLQRISLGALIIALGLLVDDAMIAVEMMIKKLEEGCDKVTAATFAYTSTAFPMLTGTLVTIAGFVPVGFAASSAGEYTFTLFAVVGIALIASWFVAVLFTPLTGVFILPDKMKSHGHEPSRFARAFHAMLDRVLHLKYWVIGATVALFVAALAGMQFVQQQFFPTSDRPELLVDLTLPQGSSINATRKVVDDLEKILKTDPDIEHWSFYIGSGADPLLPAARPAARQRLLRARRHCHERLQGSPGRATSASLPRCNGRNSSRFSLASARWSLGRRSAGRSSSASAAPTR